MSTHLPGFHPFFSVLCHLELVKLTTSRIRVKWTVAVDSGSESTPCYKRFHWRRFFGVCQWSSKGLSKNEERYKLWQSENCHTSQWLFKQASLTDLVFILCLLVRIYITFNRSGHVVARKKTGTGHNFPSFSSGLSNLTTRHICIVTRKTPKEDPAQTQNCVLHVNGSQVHIPSGA